MPPQMTAAKRKVRLLTMIVVELDFYVVPRRFRKRNRPPVSLIFASYRRLLLQYVELLRLAGTQGPADGVIKIARNVEVAGGHRVPRCQRQREIRGRQH